MQISRSQTALLRFIVPTMPCSKVAFCTQIATKTRLEWGRNAKNCVNNSKTAAIPFSSTNLSDSSIPFSTYYESLNLTISATVYESRILPTKQVVNRCFYPQTRSTYSSKHQLLLQEKSPLQHSSQTIANDYNTSITERNPFFIFQQKSNLHFFPPN